MGDCGGPVVERRTPDLEVLGSFNFIILNTCTLDTHTVADTIYMHIVLYSCIPVHTGGDCGGPVVERRTPDLEVLGSFNFIILNTCTLDTHTVADTIYMHIVLYSCIPVHTDVVLRCS